MKRGYGSNRGAPLPDVHHRVILNLYVIVHNLLHMPNDRDVGKPYMRPLCEPSPAQRHLVLTTHITGSLKPSHAADTYGPIRCEQLEKILGCHDHYISHKYLLWKYGALSREGTRSPHQACCDFNKSNSQMCSGIDERKFITSICDARVVVRAPAR